jgi:hypothetical protein
MSSFPFLAWIFFGLIIYLLIQLVISCYCWRLQHTHGLLMLLLSQLPQQQWGLITLYPSLVLLTLWSCLLSTSSPLFTCSAVPPPAAVAAIKAPSGPAAAAGPGSSAVCTTYKAGLIGSHCKSALWVCGCCLAGWPVIFLSWCRQQHFLSRVATGTSSTRLASAAATVKAPSGSAAAAFQSAWSTSSPGAAKNTSFAEWLKALPLRGWPQRQQL